MRNHRSIKKMDFLVFSSILLVTMFGASGSADKSRNEAVTSVESLARRNRIRRLAGGKNTTIFLYPYHASLEYENKYICGGAIIATSYVLTAAHCEVEILGFLKVRVGSDQKERGGILYHVQKFIRHDNYTALPRDGHDIALVHIRGTFQFSNLVKPIKIFDSNEELIRGSMADISSFGVESYQLQQIAVPIIDRELCIQNYNFIAPDTFCAGYQKMNMCFGDSGSSVAIGLRLAGIVSYGIPGVWHYGQLCKKNPGVVTEVAAFHDWISRIVEF